MRKLLLALLLAALSASCWALEAGDRAPDFKLMSVDGVETTLGDLMGKRSLLLDFGSVFCANCQSALSLLSDVAQECDSGKLKVAAINVDAPNSAKAVRAVIQGLSPGYRVLLDGEGVVAAAYGVTQIPYVVLIDETGTVRAVHTGPLSELRKMIYGLCAP